MRAGLVTTMLVGIGLVGAPFAFQMFTRAPRGGDMLDGFRPYMTEDDIGGFQDDMAGIDEAVTEARSTLDPLLGERLGLSGAAVAEEYASYDRFIAEWPAIDADMGDMLTTMRGNLDNFADVDALPPFDLFPWFFVAPGLVVAGSSAWGLVNARRGRSQRGPRAVLVATGVGLVLAPVAFQMFTRAPSGGEMITDFESLMTREKIQRIQGYFLVIGAGEGTIRAQILPALENRGGLDAEDLAADLPALGRFSDTWPTTSNEMAPMIGAMNDNLDNYLAVAALPPFPLFPWFFLVPGALVAGIALAAGRRSPTVEVAGHQDASDPPSSLPLGGTS